MATIVLHGALARFGAPVALDVTSAAEAIRALCAQLPGFRQQLQQGQYRLLRQAGQRKRDLRLETLDTLLEANHSLHILPHVAGAKGGAGKAIIGVALVAAAVAFSPAVVGALGPTLGMGTTAFSVGSFGVTFSQIAGFGALMALGGIAQLISPTPKAGRSAASDSSFLFNGPANATEQGTAVPIVYGRFCAATVIISSDLTAEQL